MNNFHDGYIVKEQLQADGKLYLKFAGLWGCQLEVWFWGDLEYDTSAVQDNPDWFGSTTLLADGFVYLVDDEQKTVDQITNDYCYFKARHMQYHLIPSEGAWGGARWNGADWDMSEVSDNWGSDMLPFRWSNECCKIRAHLEGGLFSPEDKCPQIHPKSL